MLIGYYKDHFWSPNQKGWVTLQGTHVHLDADGNIDKGPSALQGQKPSELPQRSKPEAPQVDEPPEDFSSYEEMDNEEFEKEETKQKVKEKLKEKGKLLKEEKSKESNANVSVDTSGVDKKYQKQAEKKYKETWKKVMGSNDPKKLASLVGAIEGSDVKLSAVDENTIETKISHPDFEAKREISKYPDGTKVIRNSEFFMKPDKQGKGLGLKIFTDQIENARKEGVSYIACHAAKDNPKDPDNPHIGYYTWPRMGYDMDLSDLEPEEEKTIKKKYPKAKSILDVMKTSEGRDWWKKNGFDLPKMKFDLTSGSRSLQILEDYQQEKKSMGKKSLSYSIKSLEGSEPSEGVEEPDLSPEDEKAIDKVWENMTDPKEELADMRKKYKQAKKNMKGLG